MKVLHLATRDQRGGAARAAYLFHLGLRRLGHDSRMLVRERYGCDPLVTGFEPASEPARQDARTQRAQTIAQSFDAYRATRPAGCERFSDDRSAFGTELVEQLPDADVISLHWVASFLDYATLPALSRHAPVVWRLADLNPLTGGCHYDRGCAGYLSACGCCPQLGSLQPDDLSRDIWKRKRDAFSQISPDALHVMTPSRWLADQVAGSILQPFPVTVIPSAVDTEVFAPLDRARARARLELPHDARVVLFVATSLTNRRKGFTHVLGAMAQLHDIPNLLLVSVGQDGTRETAVCAHRHLGLIRDDELLAQVYSAADLLVVPSGQDNLPLTVLESMACGTPVVGFAAGGIKEVIEAGVTGELAAPGDTEALACTLGELLREPARVAQMRTATRRKAVAEFRLDTQATRLVALYERVIEQRRSRVHDAASHCPEAVSYGD